MSATMYSELDKFFGSTQGRLFASLNYKGSNFGVGLNTKENPETIKTEPLFQLLLAKNYLGKEALKDNVVSNEFITFIKSVGEAHAKLDEHIVDPTKGDKLDDILTNWDSMSLDTKDFYKTFVNIVNKDNRSQQMQVGKSMTGYGFNLKKTDVGKAGTETLFGTTLPFLPKGMEDEGGNALKSDFLHQLYDKALSRKVTFYGGAKSVFEGWDSVLNVSKFVRSVMYVQKQIESGELKVSTPFGEIYDLVTDKIYTINKDGKLVNNAGIEMTDVQYEKDVEENCFDTYTKDPKCDQVFECLLSGEPKRLSRCLGKLASKDMYDVAISEVKKMNPTTLKKILDTFAIQSDKYGTLEAFIVWRDSLESRLSGKMDANRASQTASAILNNDKLLSYLKNIMDVIRTNPALNKSRDDTLSPLVAKTEDLYKYNGKLQYFIRPTNIDRAGALSNQLGTLVQQLNVMPQNFPGLNSPFNVGFGNPYAGMQMMAMGMSGGGCIDETVVMMEKVYATILDEMKSKGKDLVDSDKQRIQQALKQIKENNKQLELALNSLRSYTRLNTALNSGINSVSLTDIKDLSSKRVDLTSQVDNIGSSINRTYRDQIGLVTALLDQVLRPMALLASGTSTPFLRPSY